MELAIEQALQQGVAAHKEGKLQDAERLYRAILQSQPLHPDANHNLGVLAVSVNKADAALPLFKIALEANPKNQQFWLSYIDALLKNTQFDYAEQVIEQAKQQGVDADKLNSFEERLSSKTQVKNLNRAAPSQQQLSVLLEHYQSGRLNDAEKLATSISQDFPNHPFAWKVLGAVLGAMGRASPAADANQKAVALNPKDAEAHNNLGNALQELGKLDKAKASYRRAIALKPDHAQAHYNLALTLQKQERLDEAEAAYVRAIELKPDYAAAYYNLAVTLQELGRYEEAEANCRKAIASVHGFAEAHNTLGMTLLAMGRLDEAEASYSKAIALKPDYAEAYSNLGVTLQGLGRTIEAEASHTQAIALKPNYAEAHSNLGATRQELGKLDEALVSYRQAIVLNPDYAGAHCNLSVTLKELGRLNEAEDSCRRAITLKPGYPDAHNNLGVTLQELGRLDEAEASCRQAIVLKPDHAEAHYNLGNTLKELGRVDEALESYTQAIALKPDYAQAHSNLGVTLKELGRLEEASVSYTQAIALNPDYAEAYSNLGVTLQEQGRLDEALAHYTQAIALQPDFAEAHRMLASLKKFNEQDEQYSRMLEIYLNDDISDEQRCNICFGLAKACEDLENFEQAYTHYVEGNLLRKKLLNYEIAQDIKLFRALRSSYPKIQMHSLHPDRLSRNLTPIFIVGMPRSGTTLVEQIISAHSGVTGAGELNFIAQFGAAIAAGFSDATNESLLGFRNKYLNRLQLVSNGNLIVTDKMPQNFRYLGLIAAALPEAKIVHVKRHPPAVCWANFRQYFTSKNLGYSYSIDDVISYHELYENLMDFWINALGTTIFNLDYDLLTLNQESETRQLIEYLDIGWDENCLSPQNNTRSIATASNAQVRREVYRGSSKQWEKYKPFLNGALDMLLEQKVGKNPLG